MKVNIFTKLLLTGAVLASPQSIFAEQERDDHTVRSAIDAPKDKNPTIGFLTERIRQDLTSLENIFTEQSCVKMEPANHESAANVDRKAEVDEGDVDVQAGTAHSEMKRPHTEPAFKSSQNDDNLQRVETFTSLSQENNDTEKSISDGNAPEASSTISDKNTDAEAGQIVGGAVESKVNGLIKNYMDAQGSAARMVAESEIRKEFTANHKNTCFETVKYIQDGGKGQEAKFGTLFSLMDMDARYATKGNKDILKGIREGIQMREKDARGVYFKQKVKLTPEMLCKK